MFISENQWFNLLNAKPPACARCPTAGLPSPNPAYRNSAYSDSPPCVARFSLTRSGCLKHQTWTLPRPCLAAVEFGEKRWSRGASSLWGRPTRGTALAKCRSARPGRMISTRNQAEPGRLEPFVVGVRTLVVLCSSVAHAVFEPCSYCGRTVFEVCSDSVRIRSLRAPVAAPLAPSGGIKPIKCRGALPFRH